MLFAPIQSVLTNVLVNKDSKATDFLVLMLTRWVKILGLYSSLITYGSQWLKTTFKCELGTDSCSGQGVRCVNTPGGYECQCKPGYAGNARQGCYGMCEITAKSCVNIKNENFELKVELGCYFLISINCYKWNRWAQLITRMKKIIP